MSRDINQKNADGFYPLHLAAKNGNLASVKKLLANGANPSEKVDGLTPEQFALRSYAQHLSSPVKLKKFSAIVRALRQAAPATAAKRQQISLQSWFTDRAKTIGLPMDSGACYGVSYRAMQSYLHHDRDEQNELIGLKMYKQRLARMSNIAIRSFADRIELARNAVKLGATLTPNQQIDITIPAMLENIAMYQKGNKYKHFYRHAKLPVPVKQQAQPLISLLESETQRAAGGIVCAAETCGNYSNQELLNYFKLLRQKLRRTQYPVAMVLLTNVHAIMLGYDPILDQWTLINSGAPVLSFKTDAQLAEAVISSITIGQKQSTHSIFTAQFYTLVNQLDDLMPQLNRWKKTATWQKMHAITAKKLEQRSSDNDNWFACACRDGHYKLAKLIYKKRKFLAHHQQPILLSTANVSACVTIIALSSLAASFIFAPYLPLIIAGAAIIAASLAMLGCYLSDRIKLSQAKNTAAATHHARFFTRNVQKIEHSDQSMTYERTQQAYA